MRGLSIVGALLGAALLCGFAPPPAPARLFNLWGAGPASLAYHRLEGDCETLTHSFGRNAAWGYWVMPRSAMTVTLSPPDEAAPARLTFSCDDGSACITAGAQGRTSDTVAVHALEFGSLERAQLFETAIRETAKACAAA